MKRLSLTLVFLGSFMGLAQCFSVGDGSDGAYIATTNTTIAGGEYNFTSFTINPGVTVSVTGNIPLTVRVSGTATIDGTLTASGGNGGDGVTFSTYGVGGVGVAGGANGGNGVFTGSASLGSDGGGTGGSGTAGNGWSGGGGAGYATAGSSSGGTGGFGGPAYGMPDLSGLWTGSGGGGGSGGNNCGSGGGGAGGGLIVFNALTINISAGGAIISNGGNGGSDGTGSCGGGGGGSGGSLWLAANNFVNNGTISAVGGAGGASNVGGSPYYGVGGAGADGRIRIDGTVTGSGSVSPSTGYTSTITIPSSSQTLSICDGDSITVGMNAYNTTGMYYDTLAAANGCDSIVTTDLTVMPVPTSTQTLTICNGDSLVVGMNAYNTTGMYYDTLAAANGCDSIVTTDLTVEAPIDLNVTNASGVLSSDETGALYQWIECSDTSAVTGETNQTFTPTSNGSYAVVVTVNGCSDTSACVVYDEVGLATISDVNLAVYPNPTTGQLTVSFNDEIGIDGILVSDVYGRVVISENAINSDKMVIDLTTETNGVYFIDVVVDGYRKRIKVIKS